MKAVAGAGHEIGVHGYSHENPIGIDPRAGNRGARQMHRPGDDAVGQAADRVCRAVVGVSTITNELLLERGIKYATR